MFLLTFSRKLPAGISVFKTALRKLQTEAKTSKGNKEQHERGRKSMKEDKGLKQVKILDED